SKPESAANQRWRRDRIDVVVDGPDEVILRQLYGLAIRIEPLQLAQQLVQLTLATEVIEKNESASVQVFLEVGQLVLIHRPIARLTEVQNGIFEDALVRQRKNQRRPLYENLRGALEGFVEMKLGARIVVSPRLAATATPSPFLAVLDPNEAKSMIVLSPNGRSRYRNDQNQQPEDAGRAFGMHGFRQEGDRRRRYGTFIQDGCM